jgi:hypothetical protein
VDDEHGDLRVRRRIQSAKLAAKAVVVGGRVWTSVDVPRDAGTVEKRALAARTLHDLAGAEEDRVEHLLGEPPGERVLLADVFNRPK